ncbi:hypothetical protein H7K45_23495 [Mycobacterium yunnanensis]|uniref:Uncharacterized protein n=1 Tax=Mycobacterium yunnanensis TaxID=368477 RepID=A0A9X2Z7D6_9MYCO|nr:hypothetical protein [Mycobacterium yunnanensis]MCV7423525.1 hypothetical protein [Mycobacterium yunnanensis]
MDKLHWVTSTLGIVLALGLTRLLTTGVSLFRVRDQVKMDWMAVVWAGSIFLLLLQLSWATLYLAQVDTNWTFPKFLVVLSEATLLYVAAALILPSHELRAGETLRDYFDKDGHWAVAVVAVYKAVAMLMNWAAFDAWPLTRDGAVNAVLLVSATAFGMTHRVRAQWVTTLVFAAVLVGAAFLIG